MPSSIYSQVWARQQNRGVPHKGLGRSLQSWSAEHLSVQVRERTWVMLKVFFNSQTRCVAHAYDARLASVASYEDVLPTVDPFHAEFNVVVVGHDVLEIDAMGERLLLEII